MKPGKGKRTQGKKKSGENIGFQFNAPVTAEQQTFVNGNVNNLNVNRGLSKEELEQLAGLFLPFREQVGQVTPPDKQTQIEEKVQELHTELSKGQNANTGQLTKIVDGIVELVPGALSSVTSLFATPILGGLVGPVAKFVLHHLRK